MGKFIPHHSESLLMAQVLTNGIRSKQKKYEAITDYVRGHFMYDYIRAIKIPKKNALPDIDYCWRNKMGICQDIAAMTTGMLRAVGVNACMCVGSADGHHHAWVEATINGKTYRFDHPHEAKSYKAERMYRS